MISIIVPTMWRGESLQYMMPRLLSRSEITEIIVIDNDPPNHPKWFDSLDSSKITYLPQDSNLSVNPSWKLGISKAKNDFILITEDDVIWDMRVCETFKQCCIDLKELCLIGVGPCQGQQLFSMEEMLDVLQIQVNKSFKLMENNEEHMPFYWAQILLMHKQRFIPIDDDIKVFYGDEVIFYGNRFNGFKSYWIQGNQMFTKYPSQQSPLHKYKVEQFFKERELMQKYRDMYKYENYDYPPYNRNWQR